MKLTKMSVDRETTLRMAKAAQIRIAPDDVDSMMNSINDILDFCALVGDFGTTGATETTRTPDFTWKMKKLSGRRADIVETWPDRAAFQAAAPTSEGDFFRVPRIVAEE